MKGHNKQHIIWVLEDCRLGNNNQCLGVAEKLGLEFIRKNIVYNKLSRLSNFIRGSSLIGIDIDKSDNIKENLPDLILSAGRNLAPVALNIKKCSKGKAKIVHFMSPNYLRSNFDLIVQPKHDGVSENANTLVTVGATNRICDEKLDKAKWLSKFEYLPAPRIALLVGGTTKKNEFTVNHAKDLAKKVNEFKNNIAAKSIMVTTSRRTSKEAAKILRKSLTGEVFFHEFGASDENPFFGFLAVADYLVVTGDSVSMCSESATTGKPTFIYAPSELMSKKHEQSHQNLYDGNFAKPLDNNLKLFNNNKLDESSIVAKEVIRRFLK